MKNYDLGEMISNIDLNNIDVNEPGGWPLFLRILVAVLIFILLSFAGYKFLVEDQIAEREKLEKKELTLKKTYSVKAQRVSNLEVLRAQVQELEIAFESLRTQLPKKTEVPGLLEDISDAGYNNGLTINSIGLNKENPQPLYVELPISIDVTGGFHDLGGYASAISDLSRIVTLHDISISPNKKTAAGDLLGITITAKTYRINSVSEDK